MSLNAAVNLLRGAPGTEVIIWMRRDTWPEARSIPLTREEIRVPSVSHELLGLSPKRGRQVATTIAYPALG